MNKLAETQENIQHVSKVIIDSLDEKTCWTNCWDKDNPLSGHCRVVSAVVNKLLGGNIKWARIDERTTHYWNTLPSGKELDLTRGQFQKSVLIPKDINVTVSETLNSQTMNKTYPILLERVMKKLQI